VRGRIGGCARTVLSDLGTLPELESAPVAINDHGQIVGYGFGASVAARAFLWQNGKFKDLGPCGLYSQAVGINDERAFLWQGGR
jgi:probable HAF family extracellular repeat protein